MADSIFSWELRTTTGDAWGGILVGSQGTWRPGESVAAAGGNYTILAENHWGHDLSIIGLAPNAVFVEWYWDSRGQSFLPTRSGSSILSGTAGLGSESDAAWTGAGWVNFGRGGLDQADAVVAARAQATTRFSWVFEARTGDRWWGDLFDVQDAYIPGQIVNETKGRYRIQEVSGLPPEFGSRTLPNKEVQGSVRACGVNSLIDAGGFIPPPAGFEVVTGSCG